MDAKPKSLFRALVGLEFLFIAGLTGLFLAMGCGPEPENNAPPVGSGSGSGSLPTDTDGMGSEDTGGTGWDPVDCSEVCEPDNLETDPDLLQSCDCLCVYDCHLTPIGSTEGEPEDRTIELACGIDGPIQIGDSWIADCGIEGGSTGETEVPFCEIDRDGDGTIDACYEPIQSQCGCFGGDGSPQEFCHIDENENGTADICEANDLCGCEPSFCDLACDPNELFPEVAGLHACGCACDFFCVFEHIDGTILNAGASVLACDFREESIDIGNAVMSCLPSDGGFATCKEVCEDGPEDLRSLCACEAAPSVCADSNGDGIPSACSDWIQDGCGCIDGSGSDDPFCTLDENDNGTADVCEVNDLCGCE